MPQTADAYVDRAVEWRVLLAEHMVEQEIARQRPVRMIEQRAQRPVIGPAERHDHAFGRQHLLHPRIELPAREADERGGIGGQRAGRAARAAQHRLDLRDQLARIEWLGQVIVGAHFEAEYPVAQSAARAQDHDRHAALAAQLPCEFESVLAVEHQVEHDEIDLRRIDDLFHLRAVGGRRRLMAHAAQIVAEQLANVRVVVDDKYVVHQKLFFSSTSPHCPYCNGKKTAQHIPLQKCAVSTHRHYVSWLKWRP